MNCAAITIGSGAKTKRDQVPFNSRPFLFAANIGNGCITFEGMDLEFPDPGPDITRSTLGDTIAPEGNCGLARNNIATSCN